MALRLLPDVAYLRECFDYDPDVGLLIWRERPSHHFPSIRLWRTVNAIQPGKVAGAKGKYHLAVSINDKLFLVHRIIWKMQTGAEPPPELDHKDRDGFNNKWGNLREASRSQNMSNTRTRTDSSSGLKGAMADRRRGGFKAEIRINGKSKYLGAFKTKEEAHAAYCEAAQELRGQFFSSGRPTDQDS